MPHTCRSIRIPAVALALASGLAAPPGGPSDGQETTTERPATPDAARAVLARLPLAFEVNAGQTDPSVRFVARSGGCTLFVRPTDAVLAFREGAVAMHLDDARTDADVVGTDPLPGRVSYCHGADPRQWRQGIETFGRVACRGVWPGIDIVWRGSGGGLEYDFVVGPGADPDAISMTFEGADGVALDDEGSLAVSLGAGVLRQRRPVVYQGDGEERHEVAGSFVVHDGRRVTFRVEGHDVSRPLVIDPPLDWSTYLGGYGWDRATSIVVDGSGASYVAGGTQSLDFPKSFGQRRDPATIPEEAFVTKVGPAGNCLEYSTFFGGSRADNANGIAVRGDGVAFVCGATASNNFAVTEGGLDTEAADVSGVTTDAFLVRLSATGALESGTYLGGAGTESSRSIVLDATNRPVIVGSTDAAWPQYAQSPGAFQPAPGGGLDAFVLRLSPGLQSVDLFTYLGESGFEFATDVALDAGGDLVVTGGASSASIPGTSPLRAHQGGGYDLFVARFAPTGGLRWFTFLGGTRSEPDGYAAIDFDAHGDLFLASTSSSTDFPATAGAFDTTFDGGAPYYGTDAVVAKLGSAGDLVWASYLGGSGGEYAVSLAVDRTTGSPIVGVSTDSIPFPSNVTIPGPANGEYEAYLLRFGPDGDTVAPVATIGEHTSFDWIEEVALSADGRIHVAGETTGFRLGTDAAFQSYSRGYVEVFVASFAEPDSRPQTLSLVARKGLILDSPRRMRDRVTVSGTFAFLPTSRDHVIDPSKEDIVVQVGPASGPATFVIPAGTPWKVRKGVYSASFPVGNSSFRTKLTLDGVRGRFAMTAWGFDFPADPHTGPVRLTLLTCNDEGRTERTWRRKGATKLTLP